MEIKINAIIAMQYDKFETDEFQMIDGCMSDILTTGLNELRNYHSMSTEISFYFPIYLSQICVHRVMANDCDVAPKDSLKSFMRSM